MTNTPPRAGKWQGLYLYNTQLSGLTRGIGSPDYAAIRKTAFGWPRLETTQCCRVAGGWTPWCRTLRGGSVRQHGDTVLLARGQGVTPALEAQGGIDVGSGRWADWTSLRQTGHSQRQPLRTRSLVRNATLQISRARASAICPPQSSPPVPHLCSMLFCGVYVLAPGALDLWLSHGVFTGGDNALIRAVTMSPPAGESMHLQLTRLRCARSAAGFSISDLAPVRADGKRLDPPSRRMPGLAIGIEAAW